MHSSKKFSVVQMQCEFQQQQQQLSSEPRSLKEEQEAQQVTLSLTYCHSCTTLTF